MLAIGCCRGTIGRLSVLVVVICRAPVVRGKDLDVVMVSNR